MRVTLEPTDLVQLHEGVRCRVWTGTTERGGQCTALVAGIGIDVDAVADIEDAEAALERAPHLDVFGAHDDDEVNENTFDSERVEFDFAAPVCRVCGCTEYDACPGGCTWVEDPAHVGDLCSACLPGVQAAL